jgi:hypothetical protein
MRLIYITLIAAQLGISASSAQGARPAQAVNPTGTAVKAFIDRVNDYVALKHKVDDGIPKLTETMDPAKIAARERALGEALIKARVSAKAGDVFVTQFQPVLKQTIKRDFAKRTAAERKALVIELPKAIQVNINAFYPTTIPLVTFPGNLLKALPELPDGLEYRIVYRHIILRDVQGNYVIDMVQNVFPIPM